MSDGVANLPQWMRRALWLRFDAPSARIRDALVCMPAGCTLSQTVGALVEQGVLTSQSPWTLRHVLRSQDPYVVEWASNTPPVLSLSSPFETAYCAALRRIVDHARSLTDAAYADLLTEIALTDPRAAYQVALTCVAPLLTPRGDQYDEAIEQVFAFAETGAAIELYWIEQSTAPASMLIDDAYRSPRVRLLYHLLRATDQRRAVAGALHNLARELHEIERDAIARARA